jgi:hypothetical protein
MKRMKQNLERPNDELEQQPDSVNPHSICDQSVNRERERE